MLHVAGFSADLQHVLALANASERGEVAGREILNKRLFQLGLEVRS